MATAAEGKTMEATLDECGACKINVPFKYCVDCQMKLCSMCTNTHRNIPLTKGHQLNDIQTSKKQSKITPAKCFKHKGDPLKFLCKPCVELICMSCKPEHADHELLPLSDDPKSYHRVCSNHLQQLLEDLHEVEAIKSVLEGHITTYDEAITVVDQWELDLLKLVKDKAAKLRKKVQASRGEKMKQLSDNMNGLDVKIQEIDKTITKLTDILKSRDLHVLSTELSKSQELIKKLEGYIADLTPQQPSATVDKLLPNGTKIKVVGNDLDEMFDFTDFGNQTQKMSVKYPGPAPVAEWHFIAANGGKDVSQCGENPFTLNGVKYGPGPHGETNGAVILPTSKDQSMIVMNPSDKLRFSRDMTFFTQVYIDGSSTGPMFEFNTGTTSEQNIGTCLWIYPDGVSLGLDKCGVSFTLSNILTPTSWHKIAIVYSTSLISVYVNGTLIHNRTGQVNLSQTKDGHIHIGHRPGQNEYLLQGRMASTKFYNVALSESEIKQL